MLDILQEFRNLIKSHLEVTIFVVPILAYVLDYLFELGYAYFFSIPVSVIEVDLIQTIPTLVVLIIGFILLIGFVFKGIEPLVGIIIMLFTDYKTAEIVMKYLFIISIFEIGLYSLFYLFGAESKFLFWFIITMIPFISSVIHIRKDSSNSNTEKSNDIDDHDSMIKYKLIFVVFLTGVLFFYSYAFGYWWASISTKFLTINLNDKEYVVLRKYGDNFICSPLDSNNNTINNTFLFTKPGEKDDIARNTFVYKEIGKLKVSSD